MRRATFPDIWRGPHGRAVLPRSRVFGESGPSTRQRLAKLLTPESLFRLVLAFALATALWLYVNARNTPAASMPYGQPISISAENVPPGLTVSNVLPSVHLMIRPLAAGLTVPPSSFPAIVDLTGLGAGIHRHVPVQVGSDQAVPVVNYRPRYVVVDLQHVVSRPVPVTIHVLEAPPYGYALKSGSPSASPSTVKVTGPTSFVKQVTRAVVFVSLSAARSSLNSNFPVTLQNAQGNALPTSATVSPARVRVHAGIKQLASYKTLPILAPIRGQPAAGFGVTSIQVSPSGITAYGSPHVLNRLRYLRTAAVNVSGMRTGMRRFRVHLRVPKRVFSPTRHVGVTIVVGPVSGAASTRAAVVPIGLAKGDAVTLSPGAVLVTIVGPSPSLGALGSRVRAQVNVAGLGTGSYRLAIRLIHPSSVRIDSVRPAVVTVTIRPTKH